MRALAVLGLVLTFVGTGCSGESAPAGESFEADLKKAQAGAAQDPGTNRPATRGKLDTNSPAEPGKK